MDNIQQRLKYLRKNLLKLNQTEFSSKIKISQNTLSQYENNVNNISNRTIFDICREFNVNEDWLIKGVGEVFKTESKENVDLLARQYNLNPKAKNILENFVKLDEDKMDLFIEIIENVLGSTINSDKDVELSEEITFEDKLKQY